jgi:hypothetical protein
MSKKIEEGKLAGYSVTVDVHGYSLGHFKRFLGRLLTLVDTAVVDERQNKAVKDTVKTLVWNLWDFEALFMEEKEIINPTAVVENSFIDSSDN